MLLLIEGQKGNPGNLPKSNFLMENEYEIYFHSDFQFFENFTFIYVKCTYKQTTINV